MNYEDLEGEFECYSAIITIRETFQEIYEIMGIADIGKNITGVIDATQKIADIALRIKNTEILESILELKTQLVGIKGSLIDAKEENVNLREESLGLREENKKLKQQLAQPKTKTGLVKIQAYWYTSEDAMNPVCSACYDSLGKIIRLVPTDRSTKMATKHNYQCPSCKTTS